MPVLGCDISHWQSNIDFYRMRAAGVRFAFIKASEHTTWVDDRFRYNWTQARRAGLLVGAYHYYRPGYNPATQAGNFFQAVANMDFYGDLPPVVDFEEPDTAANLKLFLDQVQNLFGRKPLIYTSAGLWCNPFPAWSSAYDLWVANYTTGTAPLLPSGWTRWAFWQYTRKGDGVYYGVENKELDLDWWFASEADLTAYAGQQPVIPPSPAAAKVLAATLNIRSTPDSASTANIVATTTAGKVIAVEGEVLDAQNRTWYQVGRGLFLAGWLCAAVG